VYQSGTTIGVAPVYQEVDAFGAARRADGASSDTKEAQPSSPAPRRRAGRCLTGR